MPRRATERVLAGPQRLLEAPRLLEDEHAQRMSGATLRIEPDDPVGLGQRPSHPPQAEKDVHLGSATCRVRGAQMDGVLRLRAVSRPPWTTAALEPKVM